MSQCSSLTQKPAENNSAEERARDLVAQMTLAEKIGQMSQFNGGGDHLRQLTHEGRVGSVLNEVNVEEINELQRIAMQESRLGIPLLIGRDVIHGFKTIFPIPLGQAASWDPALVELRRQGIAVIGNRLERMCCPDTRDDAEQEHYGARNI